MLNIGLETRRSRYLSNGVVDVAGMEFSVQCNANFRNFAVIHCIFPISVEPVRRKIIQWPNAHRIPHRFRHRLELCMEDQQRSVRFSVLQARRYWCCKWRITRIRGTYQARKSSVPSPPKSRRYCVTVPFETLGQTRKKLRQRGFFLVLQILIYLHNQEMK